MEIVLPKHGVSKRLACRILGQHRSTQRKRAKSLDDEAKLTADITSSTTQYGRYCYRRIVAILRQNGWRVNAKWVARIWRLAGLKVPSNQPTRGPSAPEVLQSPASQHQPSTLTPTQPLASNTTLNLHKNINWGQANKMSMSGRNGEIGRQPYNRTCKLNVDHGVLIVRKKLKFFATRTHAYD